MMVSGRGSLTASSASSLRFWWRISPAPARTEMDRKMAVHRCVDAHTQRYGTVVSKFKDQRWSFLYMIKWNVFKVLTSSRSELINPIYQSSTSVTPSLTETCSLFLFELLMETFKLHKKASSLSRFYVYMQIIYYICRNMMSKLINTLNLIMIFTNKLFAQ